MFPPGTFRFFDPLRVTLPEAAPALPRGAAGGPELQNKEIFVTVLSLEFYRKYDILKKNDFDRL